MRIVETRNRTIFKYDLSEPEIHVDPAIRSSSQVHPCSRSRPPNIRLHIPWFLHLLNWRTASPQCIVKEQILKPAILTSKANFRRQCFPPRFCTGGKLESMVRVRDITPRWKHASLMAFNEEYFLNNSKRCTATRQIRRPTLERLVVSGLFSVGKIRCEYLN